jgi:isoquinoline 1-oxidoreductase alpha subunit
MTKLNINGKPYDIDLPADTPLLWVLRDDLGLTGTKFGCGMALCGACTVHIDGQPGRACVTPISALANKKVVTIEAIGADKVGKAVQTAWIRLGCLQGDARGGRTQAGQGRSQRRGLRDGCRETPHGRILSSAPGTCIDGTSCCKRSNYAGQVRGVGLLPVTPSRA